MKKNISDIGRLNHIAIAVPNLEFRASNVSISFRCKNK